MRILFFLLLAFFFQENALPTNQTRPTTASRQRPTPAVTLSKAQQLTIDKKQQGEVAKGRQQYLQMKSRGLSSMLAEQYDPAKKDAKMETQQKQDLTQRQEKIDAQSFVNQRKNNPTNRISSYKI